MAPYHREFDADRRADLAAALDHDSWNDVPQPIRLNLRARGTRLDGLLEE